MEPSSSSSSSPAAAPPRSPKMRLRRQALESVLGDLQRALDELREADLGASLSDSEGGAGASPDDGEGKGGSGDDAATSLASDSDGETDQLCDLLQSTFESPEFFQKIDEIQKSLYQNNAVENSWNLVKTVDFWEDNDSGDGYVVVEKDDTAEGMAFFIATYLSSLKVTNDLSPDELKKTLKKIYSAQKRKGKLRKAWDGTKVIYNVASWSATAIGIYHNQAILKVATTAFPTSCSVISKFL